MESTKRDERVGGSDDDEESADDESEFPRRPWTKLVHFAFVSNSTLFCFGSLETIL
jgi:hypothetical protein